MIGQEIVYAPCPCGSGKKFKFCCYRKYRDRLTDDMTLTDVTQLVRCEMSGINSEGQSFVPESTDLHAEGYELMVAERVEEARAKFKASREIDPRHSASWNNEASCAWEMGAYEDAYAIQREGNAKMTAIDSFGRARLAVYAHATGREDEAQEALAAALAVPPISIFGALEVCFALALYHRHRDILDFVAKSGMSDSDRLAFYTGIAHANLGEMGQAEIDLKKSGNSQHFIIPGRYLDAIADDMLPWTMKGEDEWPYFDFHNFAPARFFAEDVVCGENPFLRCPKSLAEDCIVFLLADGSIDTYDALKLARELTSERAKRMVASLEDMVKSEDEYEAAEEAKRAADVDAQGKQRVPMGFYFEEGNFPDDQQELLEESNRLASEDNPMEDPSFLMTENALRELSVARPESTFIKAAYLRLVAVHDPELAEGVWMSDYAQNPDDSRLAAGAGIVYVRRGDLASAYKIFDHFALPEEYECQQHNLGWRVLSDFLANDAQTIKDRPDIAARAKEVLSLLDS